MEQKAVTYKTVKGMARDMAMSSGNNDFSYENYNIRITTRGKEDSLVVTNEKGTESNIIATRDVLKTVNNVFVGMQPGFYVDEYTDVTNSNIDKYDYTELYKNVGTEQNPTYVPIEKKDYEDAHLVQYDTYSVTAETFESIKLALYVKVNDDYIKLQEDSVFVQGQTYYRKNVVIDPSVTFYKKNEINTITPLVDSTTSGGTTTYTDNGIIKFALNTEYSTDSELVAKSVLQINETPIIYNDEKYTLLNDGKYINNNQLITINKNKNYGYDTESIKEIVLGSPSDDGSINAFVDYRIADDVNNETFEDKKDELYIENEGVYTKVDSQAAYSSGEIYYYLIDRNQIIDEKENWLDSYKTLYKKITDDNFEFSGFNTEMNDIDYTNSSSLSLIPVSINSKSVTLPTGSFKEGENYESGTIGTPETTTGDYKKVVAEIPQLEYFTGVAFAKSYPVNTTLKAKQITYKLNIPIFKKATELVEDQQYYSVEGSNNIARIYYKANSSDVTEETVTKYYIISKYIETSFNFDIYDYFGNNVSKDASLIKIYELGQSTGSAVSNAVIKLVYSFYSSNPNSACINYNVVSGIAQNLDNDEMYLAATGPFFIDNIKETSSDIVPDIINGNSITFFKTQGSSITLTITDDSDYIKCVGETNLPIGYSFVVRDETIDTTLIEDDYDNIYNVYDYELLTQSNDSKIAIISIKTIKENDVYYTELELNPASVGNSPIVLVYNKLENTIKIKDETDSYYIYKITIDNHPVPYIVYSKSELETITQNENVYTFNNNGFELIDVDDLIMLPSNLKSNKVQIDFGDSAISKTNGNYRFVNGSLIKSIERLSCLPIYETNGYYYDEYERENSFNLLSTNLIVSSLNISTTKETPQLNKWATNFVNNNNIFNLFEGGKTYTVSFDYEIVETKTGQLQNKWAGFGLYSTISGWIEQIWDSSGLNEVGAKAHFEKTFTLPSELPEDLILNIYTNYYSPDNYQTIIFRNIKIENNEIATEWTNAPEDRDLSSLYTEDEGVYTANVDAQTYKNILIPLYYKNYNTSVDSIAKEVFTIPPTYNEVVSKFNFKINNFKASLDIQSFKLKRSNNNWDDKFIYNFLSQGSDFVDYTRKIIPMSVLDTYKLSDLSVEYNEDYTSFYVNLISPEGSYFGNNITRPSSLYVTICDLKDKTYSKQYRLSELIVGINDTDIKNQDSTKHSFYIKDIRESELPSETDLVLDETKNNIGFEDKYTGNETVTLQILKHQNKKFAREIIDFGDHKFTSTIEFDFGDNYKNKFYSVIENDLLVSNFGDYHALTIPGRVLGSCTIDDYVVLFFHYSSPALNYYRYDSVNDIYRICPPNSIDLTNPDYYNLYTRNSKMGFDLAAKNGSLLRDDNNDYINGKNEDYIVKLKYIDARPDNDENEWSEIVTKISNVSTQSALSTDVTMKKPYYSADILYHGNLGFNANNGIETIGYYESKDVIKVYFTDGKNQPRMIDIMTPLAQRNGTHKRWDAKSFDFIQEINGNEKYEITKQFGGGAFPAGTVQYYFTYTNLGGCETNPFICSQIYYTSQSDTGNSPVKITDNTFKIKLTNLSTRFDYVNIYSVVRTTKDMQTLCKKVINISLNGKTEIEFTDNNLLGEIVDSSYLLMLQGTPISALTMAEKDNTLFLGNINKLQKALTSEDKNKLRNCFEVKEDLREYQNYNPNEENWYENKFRDKIKLDYYGNEVKDEQGNTIIDSKISLEGNSSDIKTFMYNEYYRLGIQLQDKFGKWSDPIFIKDVKCDQAIETSLTETEDKEDKHTYVNNLISKIPYFYLEVKDKDELKNIIADYDFIRIRPVIVYPNISSRNVLCQGLLNPTMFNYSDRSMNAPYNFASYFFRPMPPAISYNKDDSGNSLHNPSLDEQKVCGYPIEYRHGYPISGYHDAIEEGLAETEDTSNVDDNTVKTLVDNYLSKQNLTSVKLTSNTIGWYIGQAMYVRDGEISLVKNGNDVNVFYKGKIYGVDEKKNKGNIKIKTNYTPTSSPNLIIKTPFTSTLRYANILGQKMGLPDFLNSQRDENAAVGFSSHMHYFKNKLLREFINIASWLSFDPVTQTAGAILAAQGPEIIKKIGETECAIDKDGLCFNEGNIDYKAEYPVTIKITPKSDIKLKRHRGLRRKTYFCDIAVVSNNITALSKAVADSYIDNTNTDNAVNNKAYFAFNDGEIQCANGNKNYNFFVDKLKTKLDNTYNSSEISPASRQQSLFYIDESICTLNSPEIEYDPTVQKIDLSTYKLNIVGAANITGYAQKVNIDAETPPATAGTTVCEGFKHDNVEVQNFNKEAYRYMLSGGYWYDNVFSEGDDEEPEKKYDSADLISDQYCWWVYPFNRQILNNSKEGANGKLRTKQWYNYHYSAFNDYFKTSSIDYELKDAQQIYGDFQSVNFDSDWTTRKCLYFGSVDTAYTNPIPLCGILGGSNEPEENAYEQSLAISPHTKFKDKDSYSSATFADIVPLSFRSTNHFVLSFKGRYGNNRLLPEYFVDTNLLVSDNKESIKTQSKEYFKIMTCGDVDLSSYSYYIKEVNTSGNKTDVFKLGEYGFIETPVGEFRINSIGLAKSIVLKIVDGGTTIVKYVSCTKIDDVLELKSEIFNTQVPIDTQTEFLDDDFFGIKNYTNEIGQIILNSQVSGCERPYVNYNNENAGIYKYGHVYIAQLERGVKSADEVFSGTEESVLLQNTWIPAGVAINVNDVISGNDEIKYTEGDTFYQRYDCLKTYGYNEASVNQVIESLSTMIQTRINLDGIYSLRGNVDNLGTNETNTNLLNTAYSQSDNYFTYSITDPYISQITEYCNMFTWSLTKQPMSRNDNWLAINLIAYYNAAGSFGKITRIINYRNSLFCFQDNAISRIAYNERVQLTPSDGVPIEIGNSGKVQGLNYISSNVGCQNRWSVCPSKGYLYWVDDRRAEIYRFGEGLEPFSTINGFSDWVKANTYGEDWKPILSTNVPITTYYDNNNDDIYFVTEKDCLAYNEKLNAFESFFSYEDSFILNSAGNTIVIKEQDALVKDMTDYTDLYDENYTSWWSNGIRGDGLSSIELMHEGEYNKFFGDYKPYYLRFKVYPTDLQRDKIYTNLEFNLDAFNEKDIYMPDDTFTRIRIWNEYQWGEMNFDNIYGTTSFKKRFRTFYAQLPRASYYPTGLYENYDYLYQRQLEWNYITSDVLSNKTLAYYSYWNENSNCVNDRIRNPWVWLELYKNPKSSLNFEQYTLDKQKEDSEVKNCTQAYYNEYKLDLFEVVSGKFVRQKESSTYDENKKYYNCIDNYLEKRSYLYYKVYIQVNSDDYDKYDILYSSTAEDAQPYAGDRTNPGLILYRLDYRNCANILTFDTEKVYYKLNISNNRMEIHDIILKYFEA